MGRLCANLETVLKNSLSVSCYPHSLPADQNADIMTEVRDTTLDQEVKATFGMTDCKTGLSLGLWWSQSSHSHSDPCICVIWTLYKSCKTLPLLTNQLKPHEHSMVQMFYSEFIQS